ncbi:unnamed protein product [Caenorhabditis sp. 36 PRJEB53466]|nr:unnamed protein product [Caenorhabditis sp. 36 PRJEB53466]
MKLVLAIILFKTVAIVNAHVQCGNDKFCNVGFKPFQMGKPNEFQTVRKCAQELALLTKSKIIGVFNKSMFFPLAAAQKEFCMDDTIGFLLDVDVTDYEVSCVWTGASQKVDESEERIRV